MNEADFVAALLDPHAPTPPGLLRPDGRPADARFSVYRNNVTVGLTRVLQAAFPVVQKLVGPDFFAAMAGTFVRGHPPRSRIMMLYGDEFAHFMSGFAPVADYPYLPDVARLEQALRTSYHAADALAVPAETLATTAEATLLAARITFAPALCLVRSAWPIHAIWCANTQDGPPPVMRAEDVLILRPDFDPHPHLLGPAAAAFIISLQHGATVAQALSTGGNDLDLTALLTLLIRGRAITGLVP